MQLSELYLNRQLYKEGQTSETNNSEYVSANQTNYPSSYIAYGGNSAIDVNTNTTTINGGKVRTGMVESTGYTYVSGNFSSIGMQINLDNGAIRAPQFAIDSAGNAFFKGDITGSTGTFTGAITVGTGNNVFKVTPADGMWLGNVAWGSAPFRVDMAGNAYATSLTVTTNNSIWQGTPIANAYIGNLNANKITTGTLTVGDGISQALILINQSSSGGGGATSAYLRWSGGSKIWSDSSNFMGINAIGGQLYIYAANEEIAIFQSGSNKTIFKKELSCQNTVYLSSGTSTSIWGNNNTDVIIDMTGTFYVKDSGSECFRANSFGATTQGYFFEPNSHIIVHGTPNITSTLPATSGTLKNAIVPTSQGFSALACMESPEVWFMDFCTGTSTIDIDLLFLEVTVPPYHFIMCDGGEYQVWGKRKGHEDKRFEAKTGKEFVANERFLNMSKPSYQFNQ